MTSLELLICTLLISASAYLSSSEVALFSLSRFQLRSLKDRVRPAHRRIKQLLSDPGGLLITILVSNEIVNISLATLITGAIAREWSTPFSGATSLQSFTAALQQIPFFSSVPAWAFQSILAALMTTPIVLLFCEASPKVIGARANQIIAPLTAAPLGWIYDGFKPIRFILKLIVGALSRLLGKDSAFSKKQEIKPPLREEEFLTMVEVGHRTGSIHSSELELIRNIFELDDRTVMDVYTPISRVQTLPAHLTVRTAIQAMRGAQYSRIPVLSADKKSVCGILHAKDLLATQLHPEMENNPIEALMRKPLLIPPATRLNALFRSFKQNRTHMAIIVVGGNNGEALGVVTMADVLDAIFEEILKEKDLTGRSGR